MLTGNSNEIPEIKKSIVKNLYLSNIAEEFIAMQVDLEQGDESLQ
ncbi:MAG: hypothetical protein WBZ36_27065 [Candidatus Nitrosopolaris sp.]|jgi:hypothetical protein